MKNSISGRVSAELQDHPQERPAAPSCVAGSPNLHRRRPPARLPRPPPELLDATPGGGVGYLLTDRVGHVREFLDSLDRVAAGGTVVDPDVVRRLLGRRRGDGPLTDREGEVLALMAEGRTNCFGSCQVRPKPGGLS